MHPGTAIVVDRLLDMTRLAGDCHVVVRARYDWTLYEANRRMDVYDATFDWHTIEGPCVVKHDGRYYCFYSGANYQTDRYGVDYVVADHPLGPYTGQGDHARVLHSVAGQSPRPGASFHRAEPRWPARSTGLSRLGPGHAGALDVHRQAALDARRPPVRRADVDGSAGALACSADCKSALLKLVKVHAEGGRSHPPARRP